MSFTSLSNAGRGKAYEQVSTKFDADDTCLITK
jgi:hypothetical protein